MKIVKSIAIITLVFLVATSCQYKPKAPEFRTVENIVPSYSAGDVNIKGDIIMFNPNAIGFDIVSTDIDVFINQKDVYNITELKAINAKSKSEFTIPLDITFPAEKVYKGFLSSGLGLISSKSVTFKMEGDINYKVKGIPLTKRVEFSKELKISR
ncbi:MAG: LEA type 2 family protein [Chitinophagales bacterium]